jgi:hypothetical protein
MCFGYILLMDGTFKYAFKLGPIITGYVHMAKYKGNFSVFFFYDCFDVAKVAMVNLNM